MAVHIHTAQGSRAIGSHLPLNVALAILPSLPRPYLVRLVDNAIDLLNEQDGDADLEPEVTEQDDEPELDDEPEQDDPKEADDHGGGNVEDEGEGAEYEDVGECGSHAIDQRELRSWHGSFRID